jgi:hypothetical protein
VTFAPFFQDRVRLTWMTHVKWVMTWGF